MPKYETGEGFDNSGTGYDLESFSAEEQAMNRRHMGLAQISEGITHAFFLVEVKNSQDTEEGINQACRGGAAMVKAYRELRHLAKLDVTANAQPFADTVTMAYTMVLTPVVVNIYIHWAEVAEEMVIYHMHVVGGYAIAMSKAVKDCRAAINNVLDWGLGERKKEIGDCLRRVYDVQNGPSKVPEGASGKGAASMASSSELSSPSVNKRPRTDSST